MHLKTISLINNIQKDSSYDKALSIFFVMARQVIKLTGFNSDVIKVIIDVTNKLSSNLHSKELISDKAIKRSEDKIGLYRKTRDAKVLLNTTRKLLKQTRKKISMLPQISETREQIEDELKLKGSEVNYIKEENKYERRLKALKRSF